MFTVVQVNPSVPDTSECVGIPSSPKRRVADSTSAAGAKFSGRLTKTRLEIRVSIIYPAAMKISTYRETVLRRLIGEYGCFCWYCCKDVKLRVEFEFMRDDDATIDHVVALSNGGSRYRYENLALSCRKCNHAKDDRDLYDFLDRPYRLKGRSTQSHKRLIDSPVEPYIPLGTIVSFRSPMFTGWPWLEELITQRVKDVGYGPWKD